MQGGRLAGVERVRRSVLLQAQLLGYVTGIVASVAERLACWTQALKGPGSNRSRDAVLGRLFTPIVPLFTKQQNW